MVNNGCKRVRHYVITGSLYDVQELLEVLEMIFHEALDVGVDYP